MNTKRAITAMALSAALLAPHLGHAAAPADETDKQAAAKEKLDGPT